MADTFATFLAGIYADIKTVINEIIIAKATTTHENVISIFLKCSVALRISLTLKTTV
ncbi:hypothetical protein SDC9_160130 [bioreactor metagenome]|uniref:Uncharacterized protein n=1 Tax=bioreactor metagenome TaxID=1076179 RepID=A0A645FFT7_9ZZZZ